MDFKKIKRLLNQVIIVGKTKKTFWRKSKDFELQIHYTPLKNKIVIITIDGVDLDHPQLYFNFNIGNDMSDVFNWIEENGHQIVFIKKRLGV